eukprot:8806681-Alexandrium_andersonii.AAC.1
MHEIATWASVAWRPPGRSEGSASARPSSSASSRSTCPTLANSSWALVWLGATAKILPAGSLRGSRGGGLSAAQAR